MPKAMYTLLGSLYIMMGVFQILSNQFKTISVIIGIMLIIGGTAYIFLSPLTFSTKSRLALKVKINDTSFWAKTRLIGRPIEYKWADIKEIEFDSYVLRFKINKSTEIFRYHSTPEISIEIKNAIREVAASNGIPVIGG